MSIGIVSVRSVSRAVGGIFTVCVLAVSGLFLSGSVLDGQILPELEPISVESLEGMISNRTKDEYKYNRRFYSRYCGNYNYDAAWIGYVSGRYVCVIYWAGSGELWLMEGDRLVPLSARVEFLMVSVGEAYLLFSSCDEDVLRCSNPVVMPPMSSLDISGRDKLIIEAVGTEGEDVEAEGISRLRSRVSSLPNLPWFAKLCYVTDTFSYSDNCEDKYASPKNFAVRITDLDIRNSFILTRYWNSDDRDDPTSFGSSVYLRDIGSTEPVEVSCSISKSDFSAPYLEGYHRYVCTGHTLKFEGSFIVIGSDRTAAASGGAIAPLPKPEVRVVAMEITQGLQNWKNTVTLVRNRRTVVRIFMETTAMRRKITAELKGTKIVGSVRKEFDDSPRPPINYERKVEVKSNVTEHRRYMESSLNFLLPDDWVNLATDEELELELIFSDENIDCNNKCIEKIEFTELTNLPNIVMVPLSVINEEDSSISETQETDLDEQFQRLLSVLPLPNIEYTPFDEAPRKHMFTPFDSIEPIGRREHIIYYARRLSTLQGRGPRNYVYLGVLLGTEDCQEKKDCDLVSGQAIDIGGSAAVWYTGGEKDGTGLLSQSGKYRNIGGHEFGHVLDQEHPIRFRNESNRKGDGSYRGECGEESEARDVYPHFYKVGIEGRYTERDKNEKILKEDKGWRPALGPLEYSATPETEIWGLDTRFAYHFPYTGYSNLAVIDPYIIFSLMSYCGNRPTTIYNQGNWIDVFHYEDIVDLLSLTLLERYGTDDVSIVSSNLFSGSIMFSEGDSIVGAELNSVFSGSSYPKPSQVGEFILELRDEDGSTVRSIPFSVQYYPYQNESEDVQEAIFSVTVTDTPEYSSFAVTKDGHEIAIVNRSLNTPLLSVSGLSEGESYSHYDTIAINWEGSDADGDDLLYRVFYSTDGGANYEVLSLETKETSISFKAGLLTGSDSARIGVSVSDGTRSSFAETPIFSIAGNTPEVSMKSPVSGLVLDPEQVVVLDAHGHDIEDGYLGSSAFSWHSSLDGSLGTGGLLVIAVSDLSIGDHVITVTATDSNQMTASASATLTVNARNTAPEAVDDTASAVFSSAVQIDVFANDIDIENDVKLDTLSIHQQPTLGAAKVVTPPSGLPVIEYIASNQGVDIFAYEICDYGDRCDTAQVRVAVIVADCTVIGTEGDDILNGTAGNDVICGLGGDDTIDGRSGDDRIYGGTGNDTIYGRAGNDIVYGGVGNDFILGHRGDDVIYGSLGNDIIYGGEGDDRIIGGDGADELYGEADNDSLEGNRGSDKIHGGRGDDIIWGDQGDDIIRGNAGKDTITPGAGEDTVLGTTLDDTIY